MEIATHLSPTSDRLLLGLRRSGLLSTDGRVLVAVSGGADSSALLVAACEEGFDVVAAHYDHALREGSDLVADHVAKLCARLDVPLVAERRRTPMPRGSIQAAARALRYDFLARARAQTVAGTVALGHTADDVVEGVVMHLMRGCGLAGLRGMPSRRGVFVRPLLDVWRSDVLEFLNRRGIGAVDDPANMETRFERVHVRRDILPALECDKPGITLRFHSVAKRAAAMQDRIAEQAGSSLKNGTLSRSEVAAASEPVAAELLRQLFESAGGATPGLSRAHLSSMLRLVQPGRGGRGLDLPGGYRFRVVGGSAQVVPPRHQGDPASDVRLEISQCLGCEDAAATHLRPGVSLAIGFRRPGLRMRPRGAPGTRKLQDIFVDAKVPREERDSFPLVFAGDRLAWVPGVAVDSDLASRPGEISLHVTVTRILA
jgi:tRNA(Ile)-lysidine synthase